MASNDDPAASEVAKTYVELASVPPPPLQLAREKTSISVTVQGKPRKLSPLILNPLDDNEESVAIDPNVVFYLQTDKGLSFEVKPSEAINFAIRKRRAINEEERVFSPKRSKNTREDIIIDERPTTNMACEWRDCTAQPFSTVKALMDHVSEHVTEVAVNRGDEESTAVFSCLWSGCDFESTSAAETVRHIHFHSYHTKIKALGAEVVAQSNTEGCKLDDAERNILPVLDTPFVCRWRGCPREGESFPEAQKYYWHVKSHSLERHLTEDGLLRCLWHPEGNQQACSFALDTASHLKSHLKRHSQEKTHGCPVCGGLFSSRCKFFDHCKRQQQEVEREVNEGG